MEADISSQAVGLASSADFSLINLFIRADIIVKSVIIFIDSLFNLFMGNHNRKNKLFKKINQSQKNLKLNFGIQNLQKLSIIVYQLILKIQWHWSLKMLCKIY